MLKVGSDFSGVGAFDQALIRLGIDYKTIYACDMDKHARESFIANYGEPDYYPENVYERDIPEKSIDVYMTSPPCQSFSLAGKRKGKDSKNGVLFFNSHEFIVKNKPRYFIFENVKGLLSDDNGKTFSEWCNMLGGKSINGLPVLFPYEEATPYHLYFKVLNSKKYGVPQNRERIFLVGIRDDKDNNFTWPKEKHLRKKLKDVLENEVAEKYYLSDKLVKGLLEPQYNNAVICAMRGRETDQGIEQQLEINKTGNTNSITTVQKDNLVILGYTRDSKGKVTSRHEKNEANTIHTATGSGGNTDQFAKVNSRIRRLTPRECFRLQDFPDSFKFVCSDTQLYKQAGNSITVGVLYGILNKLLTT